MEISDREVIGIMVDGGKRVCDHAIEQWLSGKYDFPAPEYAEENRKRRREHEQRWKAIRERIGEIAKRIKEKT
jgi:hypothetical protein